MFFIDLRCLILNAETPKEYSTDFRKATVNAFKKKLPELLACLGNLLLYEIKFLNNQNTSKVSLKGVILKKKKNLQC